MTKPTSGTRPAGGAETARLQSFSLPDVGEGLTEAEILEWRIAVGDSVTVNQVIVEIETAKAAVELPSPYTGRVHALLVEPGTTVPVGTPIITVDTDPDAGSPPDGAAPSASGAGPPASTAAQPASSAAQPAAGPAGDDDGSAEGGAKIGEVTADGRIATLVGYVPAGSAASRRPRRRSGAAASSDSAAASAVSPDGPPLTAPPTVTAVPAPRADAVPQVDAVSQGSADGAPAAAVASSGRGATESVRAAPGSASLAAPPASAPLATPPVRKLAKELGIDLASITASRADGVISRADVEAVADRAAAPDDELVAYDRASRERRIPVKGVRKLTAAAMVASAFTAPHVTEFLTVDVSPMMELRQRLKSRPEFADAKLSPLAFAARAVCLAARRTPEVNSVFDDAAGEIVLKQYVHLGIAAATPRGLIVPVIRDADALDLAGLAAALAELTATARAGHTAPDQMTGGTFTITNVGVFGVDTGTPIINPGESAILALGSIKDAPWVVDGQLAVRKVCQLALSFDHRVVDGQQGSQFLADVGALLADPGLAFAF